MNEPMRCINVSLGDDERPLYATASHQFVLVSLFSGLLKLYNKQCYIKSIGDVSSSCNTLRHWFMPIYSYITLFSCIVSFVQEHLACLWLLGRGCQDIPALSHPVPGFSNDHPNAIRTLPDAFLLSKQEAKQVLMKLSRIAVSCSYDIFNARLCS